MTGANAVRRLALATLVIVALAACYWLGRRTGPSYSVEAVGRLAAMVELIDSLPQEERSGEMIRLIRAHPQFRLGLVSPGATLEDKSAEPQARHLARTLGPRFAVRSLRDRDVPDDTGVVAVGLPGGWSLTATLPAQ